MLAISRNNRTLRFTTLNWCICYYFCSFGVIYFWKLNRTVIESTKMIYFLVIGKNCEICVWTSDGNVLAAFHKWIYHRNWHTFRMETTVMIISVAMMLTTTWNRNRLFFDTFVLFWSFRNLVRYRWFRIGGFDVLGWWIRKGGWLRWLIYWWIAFEMFLVLFV